MLLEDRPDGPLIGTVQNVDKAQKKNSQNPSWTGGGLTGEKLSMEVSFYD